MILVWRDKIINKLQAQDCEYIMKENGVKPASLARFMDEKIKQLTRNFIINSLNLYHH